MFVALSGSMPRKLLVVEDDAITRWNVSDFLREQGFDVEQIPDGTRALERCKEGKFDLILTDFRLPGIDGLKLLQRVRSVSPSTPVIIMTGTPSFDARNAQSGGAADFIRKPLQLGKLLAKIKNLLDPQH
jgi:DNA-binding NtrC family response regulator